MTGTLYENLPTFIVALQRMLLKMRRTSDKCRRENQKKHFMFDKFSLSLSLFWNRAVYEIMRKDYGTSRQAKDGNIVGRMRIACRITDQEYIHTHSLITFDTCSFPRQQLHEGAWMLLLRYRCHEITTFCFSLCLLYLYCTWLYLYCTFSIWIKCLVTKL
jgi:hypothetical protein